MSAAIQLIPVHPSSSDVLNDRATLTVGPDSSTVFLGDNDATEIVDPALDSKVVKVYRKVRDNATSFFAFCLQNARGQVKLNGVPMLKGGRRELKTGDVVALGSSDADGDYCYRVEPLNSDETSTTNNTANATTAAKRTVGEVTTIDDTETDETGAAGVSSAAAASVDFPKEIGEEAMCAVCFEIMWGPTVVNCGHTFCKGCIAAQTECPECRGPITARATNHFAQNMIERLADLSSKGTPVFDKEDLESYQKRAQSNGAARAASSSMATTRQSARKRRREMRRLATRSRGSVPSGAEVILCLDD